MRNLKRALSLALASVMLVGMMVVGTSAAYNDVDTADNIEAIEVLQAVGIMVGDENGNFNPENLVTRQEMAVVMSNLMDYRVATYAGTAPFGDVADWAEPYVAACYTNGITSGMGANYYGATEYVTTAQAALMLMKALGYFQYQSDFEGDWQLATVKQANKIELFDDVDSGVKEPMTRNDLAQLVLNTLEAGMVEADNDVTKVEAGDVKVETGKVDYIYVLSQKDYAKAISKLEGVSATSISTSGPIVELGEKLYDGKLKKYDEGNTDAFGRPAVKWTYKTENVGTYAKQAAAIYTAKVTRDTIYNLLGTDVIEDYKMTAWVDGEAVVATPAAISEAYAQKNSTSAAAASGKGVLTEVYVDSDKDAVVFVTVNTYLMQATADYSASKEAVNVSVLTEPVGATVTTATLDVDDFEVVADVAEDDYILYTYSKKTAAVEAVAIADVVTGEVTAYSPATKAYGSASGSVTLDGTKHDYAKWAEVNGDNGCAVEYAVGENAGIVLDAYGYVLYVDDSALSVGNYVYVSAIANETNLSTKVIADAYFTDGTNETITLKPGTDLADSLNGDRMDVEGWFSWTKNSKDEYTLKPAVTSTVIEGATKIENNRVNIAGAKKGNNKTIFIVVDKDDEVTLYTGIANVPEIQIADDGIAVYMCDKDTASKAASVVFVDAGSEGKVKNAAADSLIYTLKLDTTYIDNTDNEKIFKWVVMKDGVVEKIDTKEDWDKGVLYEDYTTDADGYYEAGEEFDTTEDDKIAIELADDTIKHSGSTLTIAGTELAVDADTDIKVVMLPANKGDAYVLSGDIMTDNAADYEVISLTAKQLASFFDGYTLTGTANVIYDDIAESDLVTTIYVAVTAAAEA